MLSTESWDNCEKTSTTVSIYSLDVRQKLQF